MDNLTPSQMRAAYEAGTVFVKTANSDHPWPKGTRLKLWNEEDQSSAPWLYPAELKEPSWSDDVWSVCYANLEFENPVSTVDHTYDELNQGERVHMFNKLAKHGYDRRHGKTILKYLSDEQRQELEEALGEEPEKPVYSIGDRYMRGVFDQQYLISAVSRDHVALINLTTGLRFSDPIQVDDPRAFTESPFDGHEHEFTMVL